MEKELKKFRITADATFWAEDIYDALAKLAEHFRIEAEGGEDSLLDAPSHIRIRPDDREADNAVPVPSINISGEVIKCES